MKKADFTNAPLPIKSLVETPPHVAELLDTEVAASRALAVPELIRNAENLRNRFTYLLKYLVHNDIPNIEEDTDLIRRSAMELRRDILMEYNISKNQRTYYSSLRYQRMRPEENLASLVSDYLTEMNRRRNDPTAMMSNAANTRLEELSSDIFERIRTAYSFSEHTALLESLLTDPELPIADRVLWTGAIGAGQTEYYDKERTDFLLKMMNEGDTKVRVSSAVWLAVSLAYAPENKYANVDFPFKAISVSPEKDLFSQAVYEIARLVSVSRMKPSDRAELIPSMDSILKNMNLPGNAEQAREMMKNPGAMASSPEMYDWMHRFNQAIREGYDVQASTLGRLRHWNFFGKLSNWLLPYDPNHSALAGIADEDGAPLADMLNKIGSLIDSDKYALILSLNNVPASMREAAIQGNMEQMGGASEEIDEALSEEARESSKIRNQVNTYAKQVWRVLTSHPKSSELQPGNGFANYVARLPKSGTLFSDQWLLSTADMLYKTKDTEGVLQILTRLAASAESAERMKARAVILNPTPQNINILKEYFNNHPDDIESGIQCVNAGLFFPELKDVFHANEMTDSENIPFLQAYEKVLEYSQDYTEAINQLLALEYLDAANTGTYRSRRAELLLVTHQWSEAIENIDAIPVSSPREIATAAFILWMGGERPRALALLEEKKSEPGLGDAMDNTLSQIGTVANRAERAMLHYLMESWEYILSNSNPLNQ